MGRMEKINELMKREISNIIQREVHDPRVQFVSIISVNVSPDLHMARVSFSVLGDEKKKEEAQAALDKAHGYIRKLVGKRISLRYTPDIEFIYDRSIEYSARIEKTLADIKEEASVDSEEDSSNKGG